MTPRFSWQEWGRQGRVVCFFMKRLKESESIDYDHKSKLLQVRRTLGSL